MPVCTYILHRYAFRQILAPCPGKQRNQERVAHHLGQHIFLYPGCFPTHRLALHLCNLCTCSSFVVVLSGLFVALTWLLVVCLLLCPCPLGNSWHQEVHRAFPQVVGALILDLCPSLDGWIMLQDIHQLPTQHGHNL